MIFNPFSLIPLFNQYRQNPAAFLASKGLNIPQEYMSSPETAAKYLMQQKNMSQSDINNMMNMANQFQNTLNTIPKNSQGMNF